MDTDGWVRGGGGDQVGGLLVPQDGAEGRLGGITGGRLVSFT